MVKVDGCVDWPGARVFDKRVTVLVGHFGSGKSEIALNHVFNLAHAGVSVTLADLDVVKPFFRSRAAKALLREAGVCLLAPSGAQLYADLPIIVPEVRGAVAQPGRRVVCDAGGDPTGARVLGSLRDVLPQDETDCLVVLNFKRPGTQTVAQAEAMIAAIEAASRMQATGVIANTHLLEQTTPEVILEGYTLAEETSRRLGVPLRALAIPEEQAPGISSATLSCEILRLRRLLLPDAAVSLPHQRASGPLFVLT